MLDFKLCRKKKHLDLVRSYLTASNVALKFGYLIFLGYKTLCDTCMCVLKLATFVIPFLARARSDRYRHRREGSFSGAAERI